MNKFDDVKVGDIVYIQVEVMATWGIGKHFWVPRPVERVTPKQFVIANNRYKKENGELIGNSFYKAANLGDKINGRAVKDQASEKNQLAASIRLAREGNETIKGMRLNYAQTNLEEITEKLEELDRLINKAK